MPNKPVYTFDDFLKRARNVHGDEYEYDSSTYVKMNQKMRIYCKKHNHWFEQSPQKHVHGQGCPICRYEKSAKHASNTFEEFEDKANKIHNNKYRYYHDYVSNKEKIKIYCPILDENGEPHGDFYMMPNNHINSHHSQGCPKCGRIKCADSRRSDTLEFIKKAQLINGDKIDYSRVEYKGNRTKVELVCPKHGSFWQTPSNHLHGQGCPLCKSSRLEKFVRHYLTKNNINFVEQHKFPSILPVTWSVDFYIPSKNAVIECQGIQHFDVAEWDVFNEEHLELLKKRDFEKYKLLTDANITVLYYSDEDIEFPYDVITCEKDLINKINSLEEHPLKLPTSIHTDKFVEFLSSIYKGDIMINNTDLIYNEVVTVYLPNENIGFTIVDLEINNELHRTWNGLNATLKKAKKKGFMLYQIFEDEWLYRRNIVESRIKNILGYSDRRVYARQCEVKEIPSDICNTFLEQNHLQGKCGSTIKYGLFYNDELLSVMTFGKTRHFIGNNDHQFELLRFANKIGTSVVGGASKLLKHFIDDKKPRNIISYADKRWSVGNVYEKLGFTKRGESMNNYYYIVNGVRKHRFNYRKSILVKQGFSETKSEHEIMLERKIYRIYDCGSISYEINFEN